jgi:hypothetical protein
MSQYEDGDCPGLRGAGNVNAMQLDYTEPYSSCADICFEVLRETMVQLMVC